MKIGCLGSGTWGFCLGTLLATKGHVVKLWTIDLKQKEQFDKTKKHPALPDLQTTENISLTTNLEEVITNADLIFESVSAAGIRPVFEQLKTLEKPRSSCPIVLTSKGIEQNSCKLLTEVVIDIMGTDIRDRLGVLSGPSIAEEVAKRLPTFVVATAYNRLMMQVIRDTFDTSFFHVYLNPDILGVQLGGAMKNIIAIACGISDGLGFGNNSKATLIALGLHELRKLCKVKKCNSATLNGLAGLGDLCVTCLSPSSRNYRLGVLMGQGNFKEEALLKIGAVVEGLYSCVSAIQLSHQANIDMPITETVYNIAYKGIPPAQAMATLFQRTLKNESF